MCATDRQARWAVLVLAVLLAACVADPGTESATGGIAQRQVDWLPVEFEAVGTPPARVAWGEDPRGAVLRVTELTAAVENTRDTTVQMTLSVAAAGLDARVATWSVGTVTLAPFETVTVAVPVSAIPVQSVGSSSQAELEVEVALANGDVFVTHSTPLWYHFDKDFKAASVYDFETLLTVFGGGTMGGSLFHPKGRARGKDGTLQDVAVEPAQRGLTSVQRLAGPGEPPSPPPAPPPAKPATFTICADWLALFKDAGFAASGATEDFANGKGFQALRARHTEFFVLAVGEGDAVVEGWVAKGFLDANGCTSPVGLQTGKNYVFAQRTRLKAGGRDVKVFHVSGEDEEFMVAATGFKAVKTGIKLPGLVADVTIVPAFHHPVTRASAVMGQALATPDGGMPPGTYLVRADQECPGYEPGAGIACFSSATQRLYVGIEDSYWKFVFAHELAHAAQYVAMGTLKAEYKFDGAFDEPGTPLFCRCDHVTPPPNRAHCIQSREWPHDAQSEGFAQFFASKVWNRQDEADCTFVYYKELLLIGVPPPVVQPPVAMSCRAPAKWRNTWCPKKDRGTERDWMGFLWNVNTVSPDRSMMADIYAIYLEACKPGTCSGKSVSWEKLDAAAGVVHGAGSARALYFTNSGVVFGVDNTSQP